MSGQQEDLAPVGARMNLVLNKLKGLRTELLGVLYEAKIAASEAHEVLDGEPILLDDYAQGQVMDQAVDVWTLGNRILSLADRYQALVGLADDRSSDPGDASGDTGAGPSGRGEPVRGDGPGGFFGDGEGEAQDLGPVSYDAGDPDR